MEHLDLSFSGIFGLIRKHLRLFLIICGSAVVISAILSGPFFITPQYKSECVIYPVNLHSYSIESRTEQLLQLLGSNSIRDSLITKYDLPKHYDIDTTKAGWKYALYNEFKDRIEIDRTQYESVQIEVMDEDPVLARDLVLETLNQVDELARRLQREKSLEVLRIAEKSMIHEKYKMDSIEMRLNNIRQETGLLEYDLQTEELTKGYVRALSRAGTSQKDKDQLLSMLQDLQQEGGEFRALTHLGNLSRNEYNRLVLEYERAANDMTKELTYTNVIIHPEVADKKSYPIRWLLVVIVTLSAFLFTFIVVAMKEYYQE